MATGEAINVTVINTEFNEIKENKTIITEARMEAVHSKVTFGEEHKF